MSTTLITLAADYVSGLLVQGETPDKAYAHAKQRFGLDREPIAAEIEQRHAFSLCVSDHGDAFDAAVASLERAPRVSRPADVCGCNLVLGIDEVCDNGTHRVQR